MSDEITVPPMVDHQADAGPDWFFCDGCLAYHPPEYQGDYQSDYKKYCHFALSIIKEAVVNEKGNPIRWADPYPVNTWIDNKNRRDSELPVFSTQVIDGKGYRIALPPYGQAGQMRTYCTGRVRIIDGKAVVVEESEKPVTDTPLTSISQAWDIDEERVTLSFPTDDTCTDESMPVNVTQKNRKLRVTLPEELIRDSNESGEVLAKKFNVSRMTISRIRRGQRVLISG